MSVQIPKDMKLLVSEDDFEALTKVVDNTPEEVIPFHFECEVTLAKWKGEEVSVKRVFANEQKAKDFVADVKKAGGKVKTDVELKLESLSD